MLSYSSNIEQGISYQMAGITYIEYIIQGNGEECSVTYGEDNSLTNTTCLSLTNSKGIKILCTKKKKMCKTEGEVLDFISPSEIEKESNNNIEVLQHWVNAHNTQDMNKLKNLYAKEITYYGKKLSRTKCIKDKKRVLRKYPQFKIHTDNIEYISITPTITKVTFDKYVKFSPHKKEKMYPSYLLVDLASNSILVEGDTVTDKNIKKKHIAKNKTYSQIDSQPKNENETFNEIIRLKSDKDYFKKVRVIGKNENCDVYFEYAPENYETNCHELTNSKSVRIFCTQKKSICKTMAEVSYFNASGKNLPKDLEQAVPFVGTWSFNFAGGSGTGYNVEIQEDSTVTYTHDRSGSIEYQGNYDSTKNPYWVQGDIICIREKQHLDICIKMNKFKEEITTVLSPQELCKNAEENFSKAYEIFTNAQLNPNETSTTTFKKQLKARDLALIFVQQCKNVSRNTFWNGGYDMSDIKNFLRQTNAVERFGNDMNFRVK